MHYYETMPSIRPTLIESSYACGKLLALMDALFFFFSDNFIRGIAWSSWLTLKSPVVRLKPYASLFNPGLIDGDNINNLLNKTLGRKVFPSCNHGKNRRR